MNPDRFKYLWRLLCRTYKYNSHCFTQGSSKETLYYWVRDTCKPGMVGTKWIGYCQTSPKELRQAMLVAVDKGLAVKGKNQCGCTTFFIKGVN